MTAKPPNFFQRDGTKEVCPEAFEGTYPAAFAYYPRLARVRKHIEQHLSDAISLQTAAEIAGLEKKYFSAYFRSRTGVCFKEWSTRLRVRHAANMLAAKNHSISHVALVVGFRDLGTFERAFKQYLGMTPRAFKRKVRPGPVFKAVVVPTHHISN